jgi:hypothetical protein
MSVQLSDDNDPQHAQDWIRLTFRPLPSGYPPMNRLKRMLKSCLRSFQMWCEKQEFIKPPCEQSEPKIIGQVQATGGLEDGYYHIKMKQIRLAAGESHWQQPTELCRRGP